MPRATKFRATNFSVDQFSKSCRPDSAPPPTLSGKILLQRSLSSSQRLMKIPMKEKLFKRSAVVCSKLWNSREILLLRNGRPLLLIEKEKFDGGPKAVAKARLAPRTRRSATPRRTTRTDPLPTVSVAVANPAKLPGRTRQCNFTDVSPPAL